MNTTPSRKRKTLHDYFESQIPKQPPHNHPDTFHLNCPVSTIPGLSILPNFVSSTEESSLLSFLTTQKRRTDLSRRTIHYGGTYCLMPPRNATPDQRKRIESTILTADPMPLELTWLTDRIVDRDLYATGDVPESCIVYAFSLLSINRPFLLYTVLRLRFSLLRPLLISVIETNILPLLA